MAQPRGDDQWWRDAVIYEIYIRSFADGDGDGLGDIAGIRSQLPYLAALGVDAIWITPWYPSPFADGGYDVSDFRGISPLFGTLGQALELIQEAHQHGLRVLLDLVPNHTSHQHAWFQAALGSEATTPERARYIFRRGTGDSAGQPPNDWRSAFGGPAWTPVGDGWWYLHLFAPEQPDLNWENAEVRAEFEDILRFWFDRGVDGFRVDVAHGLAKDPALPDLDEDEARVLNAPDRQSHPYWDRDAVQEIYESWRKIADSYDPPRVFVAEAWVDRADRLARYVEPDRLHTAFNFDFLRAPWNATAMRRTIERSLHHFDAVGAPATWVLSNHDVERHVTRYGRTVTAARTRRGADQIDPGPPDDVQGRRRARAAALLMLALPGGAYVYQGEELGLPEVLDLPEDVLQDPIWERSGHLERGRDGARVPLPWSRTGQSYGFGSDGSWLPQPDQWAELSVQSQSGDPASMLSLYREALRVRAGHPALGDGDLRWLDLGESVVAFTRRPGFGCVVNFGPTAIRLPAGSTLLASHRVVDGVLPPDAAAWLDLNPRK